MSHGKKTNRIVTRSVTFRGKEVPVEELSDNSNIKVTVECKHGRREVRWCRRNQLCRKCASESGIYNTSKKGRDITWGNKISESKKGVKLSEEHKSSLAEARKKSLCDKRGISLEDFDGFPTSGVQYKLRAFVMNAIRRNIVNKSVEEQDEIISNKLDYSIEELRQHLESQFQEGMTWDNYGTEWHIDHVRPDSWFSYKSSDDLEFKRCWSLENLQPMWKHENIDKGNKYEGEYRPRKFYMLGGQFGVGKTTLCSELIDKFEVVSYDEINVSDLDSFIANNYYNDKPILIDIPTNISTIYSRYIDRYEIVLILLIEPVEVVESRVLSRDGTVNSEAIEKRYNRMKSIRDKYATYSGNYRDVLNYLRNLNL